MLNFFVFFLFVSLVGQILVKEPAFSWMSTLSEEVKRAIKRSRILFCNGYDFDEFSPGVIISVLEYAVEVGTSVFFDPGPRGKSLLHGSMEEEKALRQFLRMSDVLLLTADEVRCIAFHRMKRHFYSIFPRSLVVACFYIYFQCCHILCCK